MTTKTPRPQVGDSVRPHRAALLVAFTLVLALFALLAPPPAAAQEPPPPPPATEVPADPALLLTPSEAAMLDRINQVRAEYDLYPLTLESHLQASARRHVTDMATNYRRSHWGSDGSNPRQRIAEAGYPGTTVNEAIGWGYNLEAMINFWLNSSVHRRMVLSATYTEIGVAHLNPADRRYGNWWVLNFGTR